MVVSTSGPISRAQKHKTQLVEALAQREHPDAHAHLINGNATCADPGQQGVGLKNPIRDSESERFGHERRGRSERVSRRIRQSRKDFLAFTRS
jgi:hypothetical protein